MPSSFLSSSSSTSSSFPTASSFYFCYYDRGKENWSKKTFLLQFFQKTSKATCWGCAWLAKSKPRCSNPSSSRRCVCLAAGIELLWLYEFVRNLKMVIDAQKKGRLGSITCGHRAQELCESFPRPQSCARVLPLNSVCELLAYST